MIIHLKPNLENKEIDRIAEELKAVTVHRNGTIVLVTPSDQKELPRNMDSYVDQYFVSESDIQLAGIHYKPNKREIDLGSGLKIGGDTKSTLIIAGPCSVESMDQMEKVAAHIKGLGLNAIRAGSYKPRSSPYSFQGLGKQGLEILSKIREKYQLKVVTEVRDATHVNDVIEHADIVQIGARSMYDYGILKACGKTNKPVLLKRGFGTTIQEFVQAAEFILSGGNDNVILCERGIRTFETKTRFTLDLCGVAYLKHHTNLPIVVDPSHAFGMAYGVPDLARAAMALGVDGIMIETHSNPKNAMSDNAQQLELTDFSNLLNSLKPIAEAVNKTII